MSYLGLTPSEQSSGGKQHKGGICKTGKTLRQRRQTMPEWAIAVADQAGHRLSRRYYRLVHKGKLPCQAVIAVARELAGFIWAMMREYSLRHPAQVAG